MFVALAIHALYVGYGYVGYGYVGYGYETPDAFPTRQPLEENS